MYRLSSVHRPGPLRLLALTLLLGLFLALVPTGAVQAATLFSIQPTETSKGQELMTDDATDSRLLLRTRHHFLAWEGTYALQEINLGSIYALSMVILLPEAEDQDPDFELLFQLIDEVADKSWFLFDHIYLDAVTEDGSRYVSGDYDVFTGNFNTAYFDGWMTEDGGDMQVGWPYTLDDTEIQINELFEAVNDLGQNLLILTLDFSNLSFDEPAGLSAFWDLDIVAYQGDIELEQLFMDIGNDQYYLETLPGETAYDIQYTFVLENYEDVDLWFQRYLGTDIGHLRYSLDVEFFENLPKGQQPQGGKRALAR